jgi:hypothetical protein
MRTVRFACIASVFSASAVAFPLLCVACGGGNAAAPGAATPASPTSTTAASDPGAASASSAASAANAPSTPSTTTATLADGGDLQGSKLQQTSSGSATAAIDDGPGRGAHNQEPGRTPKDIQVVVQAHRDEARACYDQAQSAHPDATMKGNLDIRWKIDPKGAVTEISVDDTKSDIHDPGVGKCVMDIIRAIHFSVSGKGFETHAHYPFNFNPKLYQGQPRPQGQ